MRRTQLGFTNFCAIQTVTNLLQLLRSVVHGVLYALWLGLQRYKLAVISGQIVLRILQLIQYLSHAGFKLAQRKRTKNCARFLVVIHVIQGG